MFEEELTGLVINEGFSQKSCHLHAVDLNIKLCNNIASINAELLYKNVGIESAKANFVFPLDYNSAVCFFKAKYADKEISALCREKSRAQEIFDLANDAGETSALMVEGKDSSFNISIGNIPPQTEVTITFNYIQLLEIEKKIVDGYDDPKSLISFVLPKTLCPRIDKSDPSRDDLHYTFALEANLNVSMPIEKVYSTNYIFKTEIFDENNRCARLLLDPESELKHDIEFTIMLSDDKIEKMNFGVFIEKGISSNVENVLSSAHILSAIICPPLTDIKQESNNEIVFVIDRSGSMQGDRMDHAKQSLMLFLKSLPLKCKFQIIGFGSTAEKLFDGLVDYNQVNIEKAVDYQKKISADMGGTEVKEALKLVYELGDIRKDWDRQIIFLTDGDVDDIGQVISYAKVNELKGRIFSIGLGDGAGVGLCQGMANATGGSASFIRESDKLRSIVMDVLTKALQPRASNITVDWKLAKSKNSIVNIPKKINSVFSGKAISVFGIFNGDLDELRGNVKLSYSFGTKNQTVSEEFSPERNCLSMHLRADQAFHKLVTRMKIESLTAQYDISEMQNEPKDKREAIENEIVDLSIENNVLSRFTGMVAVDLDSAPQDSMKILKEQPSIGLINSINVTAAPPMDYDPFAEEEIEKAKSAKSEANLILGLAEAQNFDGSWKFDSDEWLKLVELYTKLNKDFLLKSKPKNCSDNNIWATLVSIVLLESMPNSKAEWELMMTKASKAAENNLVFLNDAKLAIEKNITFE